MKLENKKALAARSLNVGIKRIAFNNSRLSDIKEAITKQDVRDLKESGAISVKEAKGRRKLKKRKTRRRTGSIKQKVKTKKRDYMTMTRKLRAHLSHLKSRDKISNVAFTELRKQIRARDFRSLANMKDHIKQTEAGK